MKFKKVLALGLVGAMTLSLAACGKSSSGSNNAGTGSSDETNASGETISLVLWGAEEDQTLLTELVEKFEATYSDQKFDIQIGVESESTAKDTILTDIEAAADVFAFSSDQINDLYAAGALADIESMESALTTYAGKTFDDVKNANGAGAVEAASIDDKLYAFPMVGGNGYYLIYDSSVLSEEDVASWDSLLAAADTAGKKVGMTLVSGWYSAGFFYGAGFSTSLSDDGKQTVCDFNGTSADGYTGVQVTQGMLDIAGNNAFMAIADGDGSNQLASGQLCALVTGTWDTANGKNIWGEENFAATKLPTFTCNGEQVQMGSVDSYKFIGVNAYSENVGWATLLAEFLTNEESQAERYAQRSLIPTNTAVASSEDVASDVTVAAIAAQSDYAVAQFVTGNYWDPMKTFGEMIAQGTLSADDEAGIQDALDTMVEGVTAISE